MNKIKLICISLLAIFFSFCKNNNDLNPSKKMKNPVGFFEILALDIDQSVLFYKNVFGFEFTKQNIDGNEMAFFSDNSESSGIVGALAKGATYKPSKTGTLIYFNTENIDQTLVDIQKNGGKILYPKTSIGDLGFVAEFEDIAGNKVALHQNK